MKNEIYKILDFYIPNPHCELNYTKDYELLIATILSAQCTDKRVNEVCAVLFNKYDINTLASANINDISKIIRPCGSYNKKSIYIKEVASSLVKNYNGKVPNDRKYLESLPGVGRKTANVVLKNIYNVPTIPVDTHVERVSKRLGFASLEDNVSVIERKLMNLIPIDSWNKVGEQILLFGRYYCTSINPKCNNCKFKKNCQKEK